MKRTIAIVLGTVAVMTALLYSCKTDTGIPDHEYISRVKVIATDQTDQSIDTFDYINFSEAQGTPATLIDTIHLKANRTYSIALRILNEANNPLLDLTDSISHLGYEHLMVYTMDPVSGFIKNKIQDKDKNGLPIGLISTWETTDSATGYLRLILYHQPVGKNGTPTPGSVDYEADYPIIVQ